MHGIRDWLRTAKCEVARMAQFGAVNNDNVLQYRRPSHYGAHAFISPSQIWLLAFQAEAADVMLVTLLRNLYQYHQHFMLMIQKFKASGPLESETKLYQALEQTSSCKPHDDPYHSPPITEGSLLIVYVRWCFHIWRMPTSMLLLSANNRFQSLRQ